VGVTFINSHSVPRLSEGFWYALVNFVPQEDSECLTASKQLEAQLITSLSHSDYVIPVVAALMISIAISVFYFILWGIEYLVLKSESAASFYFLQIDKDGNQVVVGNDFYAFSGLEEKISEGAEIVLARVSGFFSESDCPDPKAAPPEAPSTDIPLYDRNESSRTRIPGRALATMPHRRTPKERLSWAKQLKVDQLNLDGHAALEKKSLSYFSLSNTMMIFYGILAVQMAINNVFSFNQGDDDFCDFNFLCSNRLYGIPSFNNFFSNITFVILGFSLLLITFFLSRLYDSQRKLSFKALTGGTEPTAVQLENFTDNVAKCGVVKNFGIYYTISILLIAQGIFSALYHVGDLLSFSPFSFLHLFHLTFFICNQLCPSRIMFQFDTIFMYAIAIHLIVAIFLKRHPDLIIAPSKAFLILGVCVLVAVIALYLESFVIWAIFLACMFIFTCFFFFKVVLAGNWANFWRLRTLYSDLRHNQKMEMYIFLILLLLANWGGTIGSAIIRPSMSTFILGIMVLNFLAYLCYYVLMKFRYDRGLGKNTLSKSFFLLGIASLVTCIALWVFSLGETDKEEPPMLSRNLNQPCVFLNFYDTHDLWHMLAASALFFASLTVLYLDVDVSKIPRSELAVF